MHQHNPSLLTFAGLQSANALQNLERAFAAIEQLGVPRMLDPVDLLGGKPDDKAVMAYVSLILPVLTPANGSTPAVVPAPVSPRAPLVASPRASNAPPAAPSGRVMSPSSAPPPRPSVRVPNAQATGAQCPFHRARPRLLCCRLT